jgi:hypothetical protein
MGVFVLGKRPPDENVWRDRHAHMKLIGSAYDTEYGMYGKGYHSAKARLKTDRSKQANTNELNIRAIERDNCY